MSPNRRVKISMKLEVSPNLYETILSHISQKYKTTILTNIALVILSDGRMYLLHSDEIEGPLRG